ncbi:hypothetical protein CDL15_Pgr017511 [Punica granatum]|uniref:Uncharacterized protein n=1 Tax=Punica granatum TaxID=22663 RepID=A0A218WUY2_PUNGR|nr:hypothetical protein CDL15_Pgr017511 [Punica granatum]
MPARQTPVRGHACAPDAPERTLARSSVPPVCPACSPARPRASVHTRTCILCTRASFQAFYRVTRLSNTSPTLSSYPEASMREVIPNETGKPRGTPFGPLDLLAISKEK